MFHQPLIDVPDPLSSLCSTPPPTAQTSLPMTGIRRSPCATPRGGLQFSRLVEPTPLTVSRPVPETRRRPVLVLEPCSPAGTGLVHLDHRTPQQVALIRRKQNLSHVGEERTQ